MIENEFTHNVEILFTGQHHEHLNIFIGIMFFQILKLVNRLEKLIVIRTLII